MELPGPDKIAGWAQHGQPKYEAALGTGGFAGKIYRSREAEVDADNKESCSMALGRLDLGPPSEGLLLKKEHAVERWPDGRKEKERKKERNGKKQKEKPGTTDRLVF